MELLYFRLKFLQLHIICIKHNCEYIIAIYALLQRKTFDNEQVFRINLDECNKRQYYLDRPDPVKQNLDFEISVINALN